MQRRAQAQDISVHALSRAVLDSTTGFAPRHLLRPAQRGIPGDRLRLRQLVSIDERTLSAERLANLWWAEPGQSPPDRTLEGIWASS